MKLEPFAFIIINIYFYFNTFYDYWYQNALQTPTPNARFTQHLYSVHAARPQRAHGVLEDPTAFPTSHSALSKTLCKRQAAAFILSMLKTNAATQRCCMATAQRAPRRSAIF